MTTLLLLAEPVTTYYGDDPLADLNETQRAAVDAAIKAGIEKSTQENRIKELETQLAAYQAAEQKAAEESKLDPKNLTAADFGKLTFEQRQALGLPGSTDTRGRLS